MRRVFCCLVALSCGGAFLHVGEIFPNASLAKSWQPVIQPAYTTRRATTPSPTPCASTASSTRYDAEVLAFEWRGFGGS